jgi:hypothetical protein
LQSVKKRKPIEENPELSAARAAIQRQFTGFAALVTVELREQTEKN